MRALRVNDPTWSPHLTFPMFSTTVTYIRDRLHCEKAELEFTWVIYQMFPLITTKLTLTNGNEKCVEKVRIGEKWKNVHV